MKDYTKDIANEINKIQNNCRNSDDEKRACNYLDWLIQSIGYYQSELSGLIVASTSLLNKISKHSYDYYHHSIQELIDKNYNYFPVEKEYRKKKSIDSKDCTMLYRKTILVKRNVVWVNFGFNIGCEFGGKHPAVILRNLGENLLVLPLSTDNGKVVPRLTRVNLADSDVYEMCSVRQRFTDVTRITSISVLRVDTSSKHGQLKIEKFREIMDKIKDLYK